ncbi:MAG: tyrosine-type recombinase/integrase [Chlamydiia bacterium]|nr:tyrosine-type recombinase/integrase [Chlamydiia bacterium]
MIDYFEEFEVYCLVDKGLARSTVRMYLQDLSLLKNFIFNDLKLSLWNDIGYDEIRSFLSIKGGHLSDTSLFRLIVTMRCFFKFLRYEKIIDCHKLIKIDSPKITFVLQDVLTVEEVSRCIQCIDIGTRKGLRDRALLEVLYASGARVSEVCNLSVYDINHNSILIKKGKGEKSRIVPLGSKASQAINSFIASRRGKESILFVGYNKRPMSRSAVWRIIKLYASKAGIKKRISPHSLRRSFATHLYENGVDLSIIQNFLGHESINTTDRYAQIVDNISVKDIAIKESPNKKMSKEEIWSFTRQSD